MRNLITYANYISHKNGDQELELKHFIQALNEIKVTDDCQLSAIYEFFLTLWSIEYNYTTSNNHTNQLISYKTFQKAKKYPEQAFSEMTQKFLIHMEDLGYSETTHYIKLEDSPIQKAKKIETKLQNKIFSQENAIKSVVNSIKNNFIDNKNMPKDIYLFLGPPAVGKTYLAKTLAQELDGYYVKSFDMTQCNYEEAGQNLYGTSRMWGNAKVGSLTSFVKEHPKSLIILDEFEKAHTKVQENLLTIFSEGYMEDACGWCKHKGKEIPYKSKDSVEDETTCDESELITKIDFTQTIFVITSNLGKSLYNDMDFMNLLEKDSYKAETTILENIKEDTKIEKGYEVQAILPEMLSRLSQGNIVLFNHLNYDGYRKIAIESFNESVLNFEEENGITLNIDSIENLCDILTLAYAPNIDVRRLKRKIGLDFINNITDYLMEYNHDGETTTINVNLSDSAKGFLLNEVYPLKREENLLKQLKRKSITLNYSVKVEKEGEYLEVLIEKLSFKKIKHQKDYGKDGITFEIPNITFDDVIGHTHAKERLSQTVKYLKNPQILISFNTTPTKGVLLYGEAGTGKTMLAKALANEAQLPFLQTTGTELLDINKMNKIFTTAKEYAPSIIFIDEIEALGNRRDKSGSTQVINQLLANIDGFSGSDDHVFIVAATNYKERIDPAILRAGRVEHHIKVENLDKDAREKFLTKIVNSKKFSGVLDMQKLIDMTVGMNGSEFALLSKECALYCINNELNAITQEILAEGVDTLKYGNRTSTTLTPAQLLQVAYHEAAHAIVAKALNQTQQIEKVSIIPRAKSLGRVTFTHDNQNIQNIQNVQDNISIALAGRLAQIKKFGRSGIDNGAVNDLAVATKLIHEAITKYGMDEELAHINLELVSNTTLYDSRVEQRHEKWLQNATLKTEKIIELHWEKIEILVSMLMQKEILTEKDIDNLFV